MPGNSQRRGRRTTPKKGSASGSGGKGRGALVGRGRTLPADERPWHKAYSGTEDVPQRTAWKQDKERRAAAAEGRAPKAGQPGTVDTTWGKGTKGRKAAPKAGSTGRGAPAGRGAAGGRTSSGGRGAAGRGTPTRSGPRVAPGRKSATPKDAPELLVGRNPVVEALRARIPATALYVALGIDIDDRVTEA
ncbi:MAG TPA: 23S rRNA (guanosine(2251)-2'-O)-methyltransferase RlmB, partial [Micromonosporaceae bacterium]|nr:23S rRNA (guanosine(2251)-2'-O)-methyltransferase RlmB [Micromonosporaceae bacterium]